MLVVILSYIWIIRLPELIRVVIPELIHIFAAEPAVLATRGTSGYRRPHGLLPIRRVGSDPSCELLACLPRELSLLLQLLVI